MLFGWLWEWVDRAYVKVLVPPPLAPGRLREAEREELRCWLEGEAGNPEGAPRAGSGHANLSG